MIVRIRRPEDHVILSPSSLLVINSAKDLGPCTERSRGEVCNAHAHTTNGMVQTGKGFFAFGSE